MLETLVRTPTFFQVVLGPIVYYVGLRYYSGWRLRAKGLQYPPGPKGRPFSGNLHQIPRVEQWLTFAAWAKLYGPIIYLHVFGNDVVVLNSGKVALELLDSRSSIYSDRPKSWMAGELAGRKDSVFLINFANPRFKAFRRLLQTGLNAKASKSHRPIQIQESQVLLKDLLRSPEDFGAHIRRNAAAVILNVAYGYKVGGSDDPLVASIEEAFQISATLAGYPVEFMPFLRHLPDWFPGAGFKRKAKAAGAEIARIEHAPFNWAKKQISNGDYFESYISKHLLQDGQPINSIAEDDVKWTSAALYVGGGDTTVSALVTFLLLMALHPEVQNRAQADLDHVAQNRLPTHEDYDSLPYIGALIREILRWGPVAPLGLFHEVTQDDVYRNYFIPKGTRIITNIWAITHDEELYPDPSVFDPSRYLGENPQPDPFKYVFGFGRRICPGAHLAEMSLFLNICNILSVFRISKAIDEKGEEIEPKVEWTTGVTSHLKPFQCQIKPRSPEHVLFLEAQE